MLLTPEVAGLGGKVDRSIVRKGQEPAGVRCPPAAGRLYSPGSGGKRGPGGSLTAHVHGSPCGRAPLRGAGKARP